LILSLGWLAVVGTELRGNFEVGGEGLDGLGLGLGFMFDRRRWGAHGRDLVGDAAKGALVGFGRGEEVFEIHVEARDWAPGLLLREVIVGAGRVGGVSLHLSVRSCIGICC
jgi:hypothetical protein